MKQYVKKLNEKKTKFARIAQNKLWLKLIRKKNGSFFGKNLNKELSRSEHSNSK